MGIALKNVNARLKAYFGTISGLYIDSKVGVGTTAYLKPVRRARAAAPRWRRRRGARGRCRAGACRRRAGGRARSEKRSSGDRLPQPEEVGNSPFAVCLSSRVPSPFCCTLTSVLCLNGDHMLKAIIVDDEAPARSELRFLARRDGNGRSRRRSRERSRGNRETQRSRRGHHVPRCEHAGRQRAAARRGAGQTQVPAVRHLRHGIQRARGEGLRGQRGRLPGQAGRDRASRAGDQQGPKHHRVAGTPHGKPSASPWRRAARSCSSPPARFTTSWPRTTTPTSTRSRDPPPCRRSRSPSSRQSSSRSGFSACTVATWSTSRA